MTVIANRSASFWYNGYSGRFGYNLIKWGAHTHTSPPSWGDLRFSNTTGILQKKKCHQSATTFLDGAPRPKKNPGSAPESLLMGLQAQMLSSLCCAIQGLGPVCNWTFALLIFCSVRGLGGGGGCFFVGVDWIPYFLILSIQITLIVLLGFSLSSGKWNLQQIKEYVGFELCS